MSLMTLRQCAGCEDDFYNGKNPYGIKECWSFKKAELVVRYRIGTWTQPTESGAFTKVKVPNCYRSKGQHYMEGLPDFVKAKDIRTERVKK